MSRLDAEEVFRAAEGRWGEIYGALAPGLSPALQRVGKHVPCPVHGGKDGFRLFPDFEYHGGGICNTCGAKSNGFAMLQWVNGWSFVETLKAVSDVLQLRSEGKTVDSSEFSGTLTYIGPHPETGVPLIQYRTCLGDTETLKGGNLVKAVRDEGIHVGMRFRILRFKDQYDHVKWQCLRIEGAYVSSKKEDNDDGRLQDAIDMFWSKTTHIEKESAAMKYLTLRGVSESRFSSEELRFHESAFYRDDENEECRHFPCLAAAVRDLEGKLVTVHRTFLTTSGEKASVSKPKKLMALPPTSTVSGASIHLQKPFETLCVAEGIETALSVQLATGIPTWSTVCANGMKTLEVPKRIRTILIWADKDRSETGRKAAEELRRRMSEEGRLAIVIDIPDEIPSGTKGLDWNDILTQKGIGAFPVQGRR